MTSAVSELTKPIVVQKYGGTSVATPERMRHVAARVIEKKREGAAVVVVVSAMGKTTDELVRLSQEVSSRPQRREMDMLLHAGEIISASILAMAIEELGEKAISLTGAQAGMVTDGAHTEARIHEIQGERVLSALSEDRIVVITGFQGMSRDREVTTLGRGGSDTSAVAFAVGIGAAQCEILTDVDGVYTADPRVASAAKKMSWCSFDEMLEMASLGSRVLHSRSIEIARRFDVPIIVTSSFEKSSGTVICSEEYGRKELGDMEQVQIRGVAHNENVSKLSLVGVPDQPGVAAKVFEAVKQHGANVLLIVQAEHHGGKNDISFLVAADSVTAVKDDIDALAKASLEGAELVVDDDVATISAVGDGVKSEPGVAARMFSALADRGINIDLISTSNLMITCVVSGAQVQEAVQAVHAEFLE